jgi:hypothetical protein
VGWDGLSPDSDLLVDEGVSFCEDEEEEEEVCWVVLLEAGDSGPGCSRSTFGFGASDLGWPVISSPP